MLCALFRTYRQVRDGFSSCWAIPILAQERRHVGPQFSGADQHDVFEFLESLFGSIRASEIDASRYRDWPGVEMTRPVATHVSAVGNLVYHIRAWTKTSIGKEKDG